MSKYTVTLTLNLKGDATDEQEVLEQFTNEIEDLIASGSLGDHIVVDADYDEEEDEDIV